AAFAFAEAGFAKEGGGTGQLEGFGIAVAQLGPSEAFPVLEGAHGVVEAGDGDSAFGVVQGGGEAGGDGGGVGDGAAEDARMEVNGRSVHAHFEAGDAAQAVGEGADAGADHAGVGDGDDVAGEFVAVGFEEG